jgi:hypothetical protein
MQYWKHPNQALNCNIFRISFPLLPNRSHQAHHGNNGFEIRSLAPFVSVAGDPRSEFTKLARYLIMSNERAVWHVDGALVTKRKGG